MCYPDANSNFSLTCKLFRQQSFVELKPPEIMKHFTCVNSTPKYQNCEKPNEVSMLTSTEHKIYLAHKSLKDIYLAHKVKTLAFLTFMNSVNFMLS